jgi:hypothetical protein
MAIAFFAAGVFSVGATHTCAQDQEPTTNEEAPPEAKPKPAGRDVPWIDFPDQNPRGDQDSAAALRPDPAPLTGVQTPTLGIPELRHSYWVGGLQSANTIRSTALNEAANSGWNSTTYMVGNVSLRAGWSQADLAINYSGGGYFSTDRSEGSGLLHRFGLVQEFKWSTWQFAVIDQFSYLPESSFSFGATTGLTIPGLDVLPVLQTSYEPNQSIFGLLSTRYSNTFVAQAVHEVSSRGSINVAGSYGLLRFLEAGNIDSNDAIFNAGYNYKLTRNDTVGVLYRFTGYRYIGNPLQLDDHVVQAAYSRKITGRLTLQLFVGPELSTFRFPLESAEHQTGMSGGGTVEYASALSSLSFGYTHGLGNGSGVLPGAKIDQLQGGLGRRLSRQWSGNINIGYARNGGLLKLAPGENAQAYQSYYFGAGLSRPFGRDLNVFLNYTAQIQTTSQPTCATAGCSSNYTLHQATVGFSWHTSPFVLR